jgi:PAS domain-containing protein
LTFEGCRSKLLPSMTERMPEQQTGSLDISVTPADPLSRDAFTTSASAWASSDLLASILDGVADGIAAHDASGQLLFINDAGARMCGYDSAVAALSAPLGDFLSRVEVFDADGNSVDERGLPGILAAQGKVVPERPLRLRLRRGGGERWLSAKATPVLDRRGLVRMSISIYRDVTRERRAEAERDRVIRELELERARLAAIVEQLRSKSRHLETQPLASVDRFIA